jgi:hypothetical protein
LAAWQQCVETLAVTLDDERPADLDAHGPQGHANIVSLSWEYIQQQLPDGGAR